MGNRVFICYARENQDFVLKLAKNLKDRGVSIWLDQWQIPPGADWDRSIDDALQECSRFLIVLSPDAVASQEVRSELRTALNVNKLIVPVLHQQCHIPRQLQVIQYVDFTSGGPDEEAALQQILRVLRGLDQNLSRTEKEKTRVDAREKAPRLGQQASKRDGYEDAAQGAVRRPGCIHMESEHVAEQIPDSFSWLSLSETKCNWESRAGPRTPISGYLDFELEVGSGQGREYPLTVISSPVGTARGTMRFPFDELALENRLLALQNALLSSGEKRRRLAPQERTAEEFGQCLFEALFSGEVRMCYDQSQRAAAKEGKGLRLKLCLQPPELAVLPWEYLHNQRQEEFISLSCHTPLVRYLDLSSCAQPLAITPPLRILGMIANPQDLPELDFARERRRVEDAVKGLRAQGLVEVTWLTGQTWRDLLRALRGGPWHVLHFIGHGGFDRHADEGVLVLADEKGLSHRLNATQLGRLLADHHALRLVVLNACEGGRGSERDIFSSTASILVRRGIPAVVAMQYEITDRAAVEFSRAFYESLVEDRLPVDVAVTEARKAISLGTPNTVEWGTPVLYSCSSDGVLFRLLQQPADVTSLPIPKDERERPQPETLPAPSRMLAEKEKRQALWKAESPEPQSDARTSTRPLEEEKGLAAAEKQAALRPVVAEGPLPNPPDKPPLRKLKHWEVAVALCVMCALGVTGLMWILSSYDRRDTLHTIEPRIVEDEPQKENSAIADAERAAPIIKSEAKGAPSEVSPPPVFVRDEPKEPSRDMAKERLAALFAKAQEQEAAKKLSSPAGDNALETYREVLQQDPRNEAARAGVRRIRDLYAQWAKTTEEDGALGKAQAYYEKALQLDPLDGALAIALERVQVGQRNEERKQPVKEVAEPSPPHHPPQVVKHFPEKTEVSLQPGEQQTFIALATDADKENLTYVWSVDDKKVAEGERFTFVAHEGRTLRVSLEVKDPGGLKDTALWRVMVTPPAAAPPKISAPKPAETSSTSPQLVMFTPQQRRFALFLHQSCFFGVQVEVPDGEASSLRYQWTIDGQPISGQEILEFRDRSLGVHEVQVTVTSPFGAPLVQQWTVEVRGVNEADDIGPLWRPRVEAFDVEDKVVTPDLPRLTIRGKVRNIDDRRSADNIVALITTLDKNNQSLFRTFALPTPQPLAPGQVGVFQASMANHAAIVKFHVEILSQPKADEDYQRVMGHLVQRAAAAQKKGAWLEAEALYRTAIKVAPHEEERLTAALQQLQAARTGGRVSAE